MVNDPEKIKNIYYGSYYPYYRYSYLKIFQHNYFKVKLMVWLPDGSLNDALSNEGEEKVPLALLENP